MNRRVLVLDRPLSAPLVLRARRFGLTLVSGNWRDELEKEVEAADIIEIRFWNHPLLYELLSKELPACRLIIRCAIAGNTLPQIIPRGLMNFPNCWVLTAPEGYGWQGKTSTVIPVERIPALADMSRLAGHVSREHPGVRGTYLGSLEKYKLHSAFPEIVSGFDHQISCLLVGDASPRSRAALEMRFQQLGLTDRVTIRGHVEDISTALEETDIFTYPLNSSAWSTSDKALQEAMWLGIPPVLMAGTALDGWVEHAIAGLVATGVPDFVELVNELANDGALRGHLGKAAQDFARTHFDPGRNATSIVDLHRDLLSTPKSKPEPLGSPGRSGAEVFLDSIDMTLADFQEFLSHPPAHFSEQRFNLLHGEGGVAHYLQQFPQDASLQSWCRFLVNEESQESADEGGHED